MRHGPDDVTGCTVRLGDTLGHPQEPGERYGRVVGLGHDDPETGKPYIWGGIVVRKYRGGDGRWPTGSVRSTWMAVRWTGGDS